MIGPIIPKEIIDLRRTRDESESKPNSDRRSTNKGIVAKSFKQYDRGMSKETTEHTMRTKNPESNPVTSERQETPSLLELHQEKLSGEKLESSFHHNDALNAEIRKEIFRKANNMNDKFKRST